MVDGQAAAQTLLSWGTCRRGLCLYYVWNAYKAHGASVSGSWPTAFDAWLATPGKHEGDRNPPPGVPVWWGKRPGSAAGDVVISLGGGRVVATDYPGWGSIGTATIAQREAQVGRPYLGWTDTILGVPVNAAAAVIAAVPVVPPPPKEKNMSYSIVPIANSDEIHLVSLITGIRIHIESPYHLTLLNRVKKNDVNDQMLLVEIDIVRGYLTAINPPPNVIIDAQAVATALSAISQDVDPWTGNELVNAAITANSTIVSDPAEGALNNRLAGG
jgi:hypothetical protein